MPKFQQVNDRIEKAVVDGYKKIEDGVVSGYKKIEDGVVAGYQKVEDRFVQTFLQREGESLEEARARLADEAKRKEQNL